MKKLAVAVVLFMVVSIALGGVVLADKPDATPQYANGKATLHPYGGESVPGSRGRAVINYDKEANNWQFQLNVWGLVGNTTYYVGIKDQDGMFSNIGSFDTNPRGNGSFHTIVDNGVTRVGVAVAPGGADKDHALSTYDPATGTDTITWNPSNRGP